MPSDQFSPDERAVLESQALDLGNLEQEARRNAHERKEKFREHFSFAMQLIFWLAVFLIVAMGFSWAWHMIAPSSWSYLNETQIQKIETILFSGALAGLIPRFAEKYI
jgi:cell division septal protein FtsQ